MTIPGRTRRLGLGVLLTLAALLLLASAASAASYQRPLKEVFGPTEQPSFDRPEAIGVDRATGDVLVGDARTETISRYHADGTSAPFPALGTNVIDGAGPGACTYPPIPSPACDRTPQGGIEVSGGLQIAIDESGGLTDGNIYVTQNGIIDIFSAEGSYLGQVTAGAGGTLRAAGGVGVDDEGTVYISGTWRLGTKSTDGVGKCHPSGVVPTNADCTEFLPLPGGKHGIVWQLALGVGPSTGSVFVAEESALIKMDAETGEGGLFAPGYGRLVAVDPTSGDPIALNSDDWAELVEFDGSGETAGEPASRLLAEGAGTIWGFASDSAGDLGVVRKLEANVLTYGAPAIVPTVTAGEATEVTTTSATLNGVVNPSGVEVTGCRLEALLEAEKDKATNARQRLTFSGATGGTYTLGFKGQTTAALPYAATAGEVELALAALPTIGAGGVLVHQYTGFEIVEFSGALAAKDVPQLEVDTAGLTPAGATAEVTTTQRGEGWGNARVAACEGAIPTDEEDHPVHGSVTGLEPNAVEYTFRLVASNANGTETSYGSFLTAHTVRTDPAEVTGREAAVLKGTVRPEGHQYTECIFEYGVASRPGYPDSWPCDPEAALIPADSKPHSVTATPAGLHKGTVYRFRVRATNAEGTQYGEEVTFRTFGTPRIEALRASGATRSSATVEAEIDPNGADTGYRFEWGPTRGYGNVTPVPDREIGDGTAAVRVSANLGGLTAASSYHYRVVATNSDGETARSEDQVLETLNSCGFAEGRCLEMVSPREPGPAAQVGRFLGGLEMHYQAGEQDGALAYVVEAGLPQATRGTELLYRGTRGPGGWSTEELSPPITRLNEQSKISANSSTYLGLAPDLGCGVLASLQPLTEDAAAKLILEGGGGNLYRRDAGGGYDLITEVAPEEVQATAETVGAEFQLAGMSSDCSHVFFSTLHHYPGVPGTGGSRLYEWTAAGGLKNVGWVPKGGGEEEVAAATAGGGNDLYNAVSEDGSRIFFTATRAVGAVPGEADTTGVFVREGGVSRDVSASQTAEPDTGATYQGATADGSRVYFTANAGLTVPSSAEGTDLYEYDLASGTLTDLSVAPAGAAEAGGITPVGRGALVGVAADGSHVYFVARGQLVTAQGRTLAQNTAAGTLSLYDYDAETRAVRYVGAIGDGRSDVERATAVLQGHLTSRVGADGRYLLFESSVDVTGYGSGGAPEAYLYDADAPEEGAVVCVSCRQDGAPSASSPAQPLLAPGGPYAPQSLVVRGGAPIVAFASRDVLAPGGTADRWNLYEWAHGQVFLVSTETAASKLATEPSASLLFVGAGADGTDLYFFDSAPHTWEDPEGRPAAWDLRVGGGFPEPPPPPPGCDPGSEGSCQGAAGAAPTAPGAGTRTFDGPGNVKQAHKHHRKHKHHRHHKKKSGKSKQAKHKKHGKKGKDKKRADRNRRAAR